MFVCVCGCVLRSSHQKSSLVCDFCARVSVLCVFTAVGKNKLVFNAIFTFRAHRDGVDILIHVRMLSGFGRMSCVYVHHSSLQTRTHKHTHKLKNRRPVRPIDRPTDQATDTTYRIGCPLLHNLHPHPPSDKQCVRVFCGCVCVLLLHMSHVYLALVFCE